MTTKHPDTRQDYYIIGIIDFLRIEEPAPFTLDEIIEHCAGFGGVDIQIRKGLSIAKAALREFVSIGIIEEIDDPFAGTHYIMVRPPDGVEEKLLDKSKVLASYLKLGDGGSYWLAKAFKGIESSKDSPLKTEISPQEDTWEPLPLDRNEPAVITAIDGAKKAIEGIRADNGFAVEHPSERESLVAHAEATVTSAINGKVTKSQIKENFIKAGRWLAEKFSGTAIGALGSELAKWGLKLLGILP